MVRHGRRSTIGRPRHLHRERHHHHRSAVDLGAAEHHCPTVDHETAAVDHHDLVNHFDHAPDDDDLEAELTAAA